jgi:hypothetical protein
VRSTQVKLFLCTAAMAGLLVVACSTRQDPELLFTVSKNNGGQQSGMLEGRVESERARTELRSAVLATLQERGWAVGDSLHVGDSVRRADWETRAPDLFNAIAALQSGTLAIRAHTVELSGTAPSASIASLEPAMKSIFGPGYSIQIRIVPAEAVVANTTQGSQSPPVHSPAMAKADAEALPVGTVYVDPATLTQRWRVEVAGNGTDKEAYINPPNASSFFVSKTYAPGKDLASTATSTFPIANGVTCEIGPEVKEVREQNGRVIDEFTRRVHCPNATLDGHQHEVLDEAAVKCTYVQGDPIRQDELHGDGWVVLSGGQPIGRIRIECHAHGDPLP